MSRPKKTVSIVKTLIEKCKMYNNNLISYDELRNYFDNNVKVKKYIRLMDKNSIVLNIVSHLNIIEGGVLDGIEVAIEKSFVMFYDVLLKYTNLEINEEYRNFDYYDIFVEAGIDSFIKNTCNDDYLRVVELINTTKDYNNLTFISKLFEGMDSDKLYSSLEKIDELIKNEENMNKIIEIMKFNNPDFGNMLYNIKNNELEVKSQT